MTYRVHLHNLLMQGQMGYRMFVGREDRFNNSFALLTGPLQMKRLDAGFVAADTDFFLSDEGFETAHDVRGFLQAMSDAAWEIGIKPKQLEDNSNELKATKYHLEDMRTLAKVKK